MVLNDGQVGVLGRRPEPGVEVATGDGDGRPRHRGERPQRAPAGQPADRPAEHGRDEATERQRQRQHVQGVVEIGQVEDGEVHRVRTGRGERDADGHLGRGAEHEALRRRRPPSHEVQKAARQALGR
jgi:hypothetical protein